LGSPHGKVQEEEIVIEESPKILECQSMIDENIKNKLIQPDHGMNPKVE
jgi:hypothetical protein